MLESSSVICPVKPGSASPAVECTWRPTRPAAIASRMEWSERTILRSFHAMGPARGIVDRVEHALELAGELEHLGAVWELDAERARERASSLAARAGRGEHVGGPLAGT